MSDDPPGLRCTTLNPSWRPLAGKLDLRADMDAMRDRLRRHRERFDRLKDYSDTDEDGRWFEDGGEWERPGEGP